MAKLKNPVLFSKAFGVDPDAIAKLGALDPFINADTKLFIDPLLLGVSSHEIIYKAAKALFDKHFGNVILLLSKSKKVGDAAWRAAEVLMQSHEVSGTCLGYGGETTRGSAFGPKLLGNVMTTAKEIIDLGVEDTRLFTLMALFESDIGPDRISDMTTNAILPALLKFNEEVLSELEVPLEDFEARGVKAKLPANPYDPERPIILVPRDILRELPVVNDWSDIDTAASHNSELRHRLNQEVGELWRIKTRRDKDKAKRAALSSKKVLEDIMAAVGFAAKKGYDFEADMKGLEVLRERLEVAEDYPLAMVVAKPESLDEVFQVVLKIVEQYKFLVEDCRLSKDLWHKDAPRHESTVQRQFFAVASSYCDANDLDISPEADAGAGPVDFKVSARAKSKVLVEIKLSTGHVVSGYKKQIEAYLKAEKTQRTVFLVVDVGGMKDKLKTIKKHRDVLLAAGKPAPEIVYVDGRVRPSASKLK